MSRNAQILRTIRREGEASVDDLALRLDVSTQTIRRDLRDLAESGQVERVHGGARLPSGTRNIAYDERRALNDRAKARIAEAAAQLVPDGASIFLNIGTTTEAVARALSNRDRLVAITNNLNVAQILGGQATSEVLVTGGVLRAADNGLVGPDAAAAASRFRADVAIIGCSALGQDGSVLDFDAAEVAVSRAMIAHARTVVLVADGSKFRRSAPHVIATLPDLSVFVTDAPLPPLVKRAVEGNTPQIIVAD